MRSVRPTLVRVDPGSDHAREFQSLAAAIDPFARKILEAEDPWDGQQTAAYICGSLLDDVVWVPSEGRLYIVWAELSDLYDTGKTPIPEAFAVLRQAAADWLARPGALTAEFIEAWSERTQTASDYLFDRDGSFWNPQG